MTEELETQAEKIGKTQGISAHYSNQLPVLHLGVRDLDLGNKVHPMRRDP
jgi:hypothetical protein